MVAQTDAEAPPALFEHCVRTYNAMLGEAKNVVSVVDGGDGSTGTTSIIVYEGFLTSLVTGKLNLSVPYYTTVRSALIRMGCIRQLRRGGGSSPSQWELIYEPTLEAFMNSREKKVPKQTKENQQQEVLDNLARRVADLESWQQGVNEALAKKFGTERADG